MHFLVSGFVDASLSQKSFNHAFLFYLLIPYCLPYPLLTCLLVLFISCCFLWLFLDDWLIYVQHFTTMAISFVKQVSESKFRGFFSSRKGIDKLLHRHLQTPEKNNR